MIMEILMLLNVMQQYKICLFPSVVRMHLKKVQTYQEKWNEESLSLVSINLTPI
jgi:hypothetical protein